jgi:C_GCAxxG_C_C family probable redox protein
MSEYTERAQELRDVTEIHYNCAQAVVIPFAQKAGISEEMAMNLSSNFGGGLKIASTCGAIVGGLTVLGLFGVNDNKTIGDYYTKLRTSHNGLLSCADLLRVNKEQGGEKKPHCDSMVVECVELVEEILKEKGLL